MTAVLDHVGYRPSAFDTPVGWLGVPRLLFGTAAGPLDSIAAHEAAHAAAHGPMRLIPLDGLLTALDSVGLTGRGGAAFPLATKIRSLRRGAAPVVVVNGCEGEPASAKDHALLARAPHLVLDGAAAVASAIQADRVLIAITDPGFGPYLAAVLKDRPDGHRFQVHQVPDRFIAGEATALIRSLSGGDSIPPGRRVLPTQHGVGGAPTLLSNAETFGHVAVLVRLGSDGFRRAGRSDDPGSTLLTVTGAVAHPGVVEVPIGTDLAAVAARVGALPSAAVVTGGYHGSWLPLDPGLSLSRQAMTEAGGVLGAGALAFVGEQTCALSELTRVASWLADQSARQCGPCAFGLPALVSDLRAISMGTGDESVVRRHASMVLRRGACAHPDGAVRFVLSGLAMLSDEVQRHHRYGGCGRADLGHLVTSRARAFSGRQT